MQRKHIKTGSTDFELVEGLKSEKDSEKRRRIEVQFYNNYASDIYKIIIQKCRMFPSADELAKDIMQETFIKAFKAIEKFSFPAKSSPKDHRRIIMKWLILIARNNFNKEYARRVNESSYNEIDKIIGDPTYKNLKDNNERIDDLITNPLRLKLQNALTLLSEKELHIIITYADESCINSNRHLSDKSLKYLCALYETTPENIRQIKKRALDKIKKYCFNNLKKV